MVPTPVAIGLFLCEQVIVDQSTKRPSPISVFDRLMVERFPSEPLSFCVFNSLTDTHGRGTMQLVIVRLQDSKQIHEASFPIAIPGRQVVLNTVIRLRNLRFPSAGRYAVFLFVDGELVAHRSMRVTQEVS